MIIDCDPGIDDALALILAVQSGVALEGITTVNGNASLLQTTANALRIREFLQVEAPVARGAARPLVFESVDATHFHGEDGLADCGLPYSEENAQEDAVDFILDSVRQGRTRTLVAIGPLTNIALALERDRASLQGLDRVVIMGGAVNVPGNVTSRAEFNFYVDPHAAEAVLSADLRTVLIPLDVTRQVRISPRMLEGLPENRAVALARMLVKKEMSLHDPLAVGYAIDPSVVTLEPMGLTVGLEEGSRGECLPGEGRVEVATAVEAGRFLRFFIEALSGSSRAESPVPRPWHRRPRL